MSTEAWNVFDLFVVIETKINFSSELLFTDDPRLELHQNQLTEVELPIQSGFNCFNEQIDSSHPTGKAPPPIGRGNRRKDPPLDEYRCLFSNILVPIRERHEDFAFNLNGYRFIRNHRLDTHFVTSAHVAEMRRRQKLAQTSSRDFPVTPTEFRDWEPVCVYEKANDNERTKGFNYTNGQLIILWLNSIVLFGFIVRLTLNSCLKSHHLDAQGVQNISASPGPSVDISRPNSMKSTALWLEYLTDLFCSNLFVRFTNRRMVNMVGAGLLVPSAALRVIRINQYLPVHLFGWARNWFTKSKNSFGSPTGSRAATIHAKGVMSGFSGKAPERLNIVQTDLCYLKSMHTSLSDWFQMLTNSWLHKHKFGNFSQERQMLTKFYLADDEGGNQPSLSGCNLKTKLYYYNLINFDCCYEKYFQQTDRYDAKFEDNQETMASLRLTIGNLARSKSVDQDEKQKRQSASVNCCAERKKSPTGESKKRQIFIAEPLHRIDLNEMGWLLLALALLYGLSVLVLSWQALFSFLVETNIKAFSDISLGRMLIELRHFLTTFALTRWLLINLLDVIIILTVFDLYQFFACCLICLSRARYLMFSLDRMSDHCQMTSHLLDLEQRLLDRIDTKSSSLVDGCEISEELATLPTFGKKQLKSNKHRKRANQNTPRISPASISAVRKLNIELEFMMNLIVVVQQELADLKKFFSIYLNLELASKSLCMTFAICALLDSDNVFECCYLASIFLTSVMPIFITMTTAAFIENQFRGICRNLDRIIMMGGSIMSVSNLRQVIQLTSFLSFKTNRSFVVVGNFSLSLRTLVPILAWIATGVVMIRRERF